jgi:hypothetical protein
MEQQTIRKTYQEKLRPTAAQERALETVPARCRDLYNAALEQRITAWQRRRVSVSRYQQEAELEEIRAAFPEYAAIHSHILQDVLARLDRTYQTFFCRVQCGEKAGFPRFKGNNRGLLSWYFVASCRMLWVFSAPTLPLCQSARTWRGRRHAMTACVPRAWHETKAGGKMRRAGG